METKKEESRDSFWDDHFPKTPDEAKLWVPYVNYHALHSNVLVAATTRIEGAWCAYCRNVPGIRHEHEVADVLAWGDQLSQDVALMMFPEFEGVPYDG